MYFVHRLSMVLVVPLLFFLPLSSVYGQDSLYLGGAEWPPYFVLQNQNQAAGKDYLLLKSILSKMNYALIPQVLPEKRLAHDVNQGKIDVVLGAAYTPERAQNNYFSIPYRTESIGYGYLNSGSAPPAQQDLLTRLRQGKTLALNTGGWFGEYFSSHIANPFHHQLVHIESVARRINALALGRVDLILDDKEVLAYSAKKQGIQITVSEENIQRQEVHFMFSRYSVDQQFMQTFNRLLAERLKIEPQNDDE
ncbi:substrate-binding periplasmic protein [Alteromonas sp. 14N.309.X.WAT.G.H12]|uniref:substrate-binding periplasmic protein n=1 Tax=Alteromonas sp. 14N.309.X.WAT.G.H12 TaxID=3120824 RepID=UPI002FD16A9B